VGSCPTTEGHRVGRQDARAGIGFLARVVGHDLKAPVHRLEGQRLAHAAQADHAEPGASARAFGPVGGGDLLGQVAQHRFVGL
jgi:hypothetical protein